VSVSDGADAEKKALNGFLTSLTGLIKDEFDLLPSGSLVPMIWYMGDDQKKVFLRSGSDSSNKIEDVFDDKPLLNSTSVQCIKDAYLVGSQTYDLEVGNGTVIQVNRFTQKKREMFLDMVDASVASAGSDQKAMGYQYPLPTSFPVLAKSIRISQEFESSEALDLMETFTKLFDEMSGYSFDYSSTKSKMLVRPNLFHNAADMYDIGYTDFMFVTHGIRDPSVADTVAQHPFIFDRAYSKSSSLKGHGIYVALTPRVSWDYNASENVVLSLLLCNADVETGIFEEYRVSSHSKVTGDNAVVVRDDKVLLPLAIFRK
jgi:hypothetical protein